MAVSGFQEDKSRDNECADRIDHVYPRDPGNHHNRMYISSPQEALGSERAQKKGELNQTVELPMCWVAWRT